MSEWEWQEMPISSRTRSMTREYSGWIVLKNFMLFFCSLFCFAAFLAGFRDTRLSVIFVICIPETHFMGRVTRGFLKKLFLPVCMQPPLLFWDVPAFLAGFRDTKLSVMFVICTWCTWDPLCRTCNPRLPKKESFTCLYAVTPAFLGRTWF